MSVKWEYGYKVVKELTPWIFKSSNWSYDHDASLEYEVDKITKPKKGFGPLAVFENLDDAILYMNTLSKGVINSPTKIIWKIFKCKFKKSKRNQLYYIDSDGDKIDMDRDPILPQFVFTYDATTFATHVKLIEEVK